MNEDAVDQRRGEFLGLGIYLGIVVVALAIGLYGVGDSGELWLEDGARYCNNGAMVHDWLLSDQLLDPVSFAKANYAQYPAHSVPYHPPGYAVLLGSWFLTVGFSYASARCFTALCFAVGLCFFHAILRRQGVVAWVALCATLILATSPETARWSRSAMSETPAMTFILAASYCFFRFTQTDRARWSWLAFLLAGIAFFCRVSSAGVLPAWFLFVLVTQGVRRVFSLCMTVPAIIYLVIGAGWCKFMSGFAAIEVRLSLFEALSTSLSIENLTVWFQGLPVMVGWITLGAALIGAGWAFYDPSKRAFAWFWSFWFLGCYGLTVAQSGFFETRYFIFSVPAICALSVAFLPTRFSSSLWRSVAVLPLGAAIAANVVMLFGMPQGLRGYQEVAGQLAKQELPGHILSAVWYDSDLIFRYRCQVQEQDRQVIRGDRVLAIRMPSYANAESRLLVESPEEVLGIIQQGRIRYLLTCSATPSSAAADDKRTTEMVLAHRTAIGLPEQFTLISRSPLLISRSDAVFPWSPKLKSRREEIFLWRFEGELPEGESELPVRIPTAGIEFGL